ncbi:MAG: hypothetical protein JWP27_1004 [Flaviaesturariibacter sp.]|nr:hypothetical protein [Flaviaesturariibacter sp.]
MNGGSVPISPPFLARPASCVDQFHGFYFMTDPFASFRFRERDYRVFFVLSFEEPPFYIFCIIDDPTLANEFGEELTLCTDGTRLIPSRVDWHALTEFKDILFQSICKTPVFLESRQQIAAGQ